MKDGSSAIQVFFFFFLYITLVNMYHVSAQGVDERMINVHCYSISALIYLSFGFITPDRVTKICDKLQSSAIVCIYIYMVSSPTKLHIR